MRRKPTCFFSVVLRVGVKRTTALTVSCVLLVKGPADRRNGQTFSVGQHWGLSSNCSFLFSRLGRHLFSQTPFEPNSRAVSESE